MLNEMFPLHELLNTPDIKFTLNHHENLNIVGGQKLTFASTAGYRDDEKKADVIKGQYFI